MILGDYKKKRQAHIMELGAVLHHDFQIKYISIKKISSKLEALNENNI